MAVETLIANLVSQKTMEFILPALFLFFVIGPLLFVWLGYSAALLAKRLAEKQQSQSDHQEQI